MKNSKIIALACIAMLFSCNKAEKPMTAEEKAQIEANVTETTKKMLEVFLTTPDTNALKEYFLFNADFSTNMDGVISVGGEKAIEMFTGALAYIEKYIFAETLQMEVRALDRNTAVSIIEFNEAYLTITGDTVKVKGAATYVMELVEEKWMAVHLTGIHHPGE
jgi:hypothetical protein